MTAALSIEHAEELALFAARQAIATRQIGEALAAVLRQLVKSDRAVVRDHAVKLAHMAVRARTGLVDECPGAA